MEARVESFFNLPSLVPIYICDAVDARRRGKVACRATDATLVTAQLLQLEASKFTIGSTYRTRLVVHNVTFQLEGTEIVTPGEIFLGAEPIF